jgi:hypothetical protein
MTLSPPIAISAFLVAVVAAAGWLAPLPSSEALRTVHLPKSVYEALERHAEEDPGRADGGRPTVAEVIAQFAAGRR